MAPAHQSKKYAVASEKASGTANLNMRAGSLNPPMPESSSQHYSYPQLTQMANARNNSKTSTRHPLSTLSHTQQRQRLQYPPSHHDMVQAVAPARNTNPGSAASLGAGSAQLPGSKDPGNNLHVSSPVDGACLLPCSLLFCFNKTACTTYASLV